jgi:hypothetical protein
MSSRIPLMPCNFCKQKDATIAALKAELSNSEAVRKGLEEERDDLIELVNSKHAKIHELEKVIEGWVAEDAVVSTLTKELNELREKVEAMTELICNAAPLAWVGSTKFYDHAVEWDRKAKQILEVKP